MNGSDGHLSAAAESSLLEADAGGTAVAVAAETLADDFRQRDAKPYSASAGGRTFCLHVFSPSDLFPAA